MKVLTAEEFAVKVMENGTEAEPNEYESLDREGTIWTVYAHIDANGDLVSNRSDAEWTVTANFELDAEQSEALMNGELDDIEKNVIMNDLYPEYLSTLKENEAWINL